ncbi:MAG: SsrA-binding protein [Candidatus Melainabacteria bacterium RIFCSPHIGHO2_02_FULL_34_12]|nr:MAG: SsrA-binding protein [Candidatus Melainabacteria bacterium RIFCSPHIGHO2_02_FULL_34_12]
MPSKKNKSKSKRQSVVIENRKARHDFFIEDSITCGIALTGTEVKSIRTGRAQLKDSYAKIEKGEVWLYNCHISPYQFGNRFNHTPLRKRKLLLNKKEILKIYSKVKEKNVNLIPLKIYFSKNWAKLELGLGKGKKMYDKREAIKKKELQRSIKEAKSKYT